MIVVKLWGGLGNQLFQFAFGYVMAREQNDEVVYDTSFFRKHQYGYVGHREFELDKLSCSAEIVTKLPWIIHVLESFLVNRLLRRKHDTISITFGKTHFVKEKKRKYMPSVPYKQGKINYYDGYWQSGAYFEKYADALQKQLYPNVEIPEEVQKVLNAIENAKDSVSVHVRKGDFHGKIGHAVEKEYYLNAIQHIRESMEKPVFFVFSDDVAWVRDNIDFGEDAVFADYRCKDGAILDLLCMSRCKHGIMSASTFSWWGNWRKDGVVIAPKGEYFNNRFLADRWIKM